MPAPRPLALVVPSAPESPHLPVLLDSVDTDVDLFVVSESWSGEGNHVVAATGAGFSRRANLGVKAAQAAGHSEVLLCNDDLRFLPGALEHLREALTAPGIGVAGPIVLDWEGSGVQQAGIRVSLRSGRIRELKQPPATLQALSGAAMALRVDCWSEIGGFDERYHFYFEDIDFCLRAKAAGWQLRLVEEAQVRHRGGGTRSRHSAEAAWHLGRSHALFCRTLPGGRGSNLGRTLWSGTSGLGWSLRASGLAGARSFASGWRAGTVR